MFVQNTFLTKETGGLVLKLCVQIVQQILQLLSTHMLLQNKTQILVFCSVILSIFTFNIQVMSLNKMIYKVYNNATSSIYSYAITITQ